MTHESWHVLRFFAFLFLSFLPELSFLIGVLILLTTLGRWLMSGRLDGIGPGIGLIFTLVAAILLKLRTIVQITEHRHPQNARVPQDDPHEPAAPQTALPGPAPGTRPLVPVLLLAYAGPDRVDQSLGSPAKIVPVTSVAQHAPGEVRQYAFAEGSTAKARFFQGRAVEFDLRSPLGFGCDGIAVLHEFFGLEASEFVTQRLFPGELV